MDLTKKQLARFLGEDYQTVVNADRSVLEQQKPEGRYATYLCLVSEEDLATGGLVTAYFAAKELFRGPEVEAIGKKPKHIRNHDGLAVAALYPENTGPIADMEIAEVPFDETAHRVMWSSSEHIPAGELVIPR